jgi:hypothetical protein
LTLPDWKAFLGGRKDLPKAATVGVLLSLDRGGTVTSCKIGSASADPALDAATCAALTSVRHQSTSGYPERDYPIEVRWKKDKATVVMPLAPSPPAMIAPVLFSDADLPGEALPKGPLRLQVQIDPQGKPLSCQIAWSRDGNDAFDARSCALVLERGRFIGGKDVFGRGAVGGFQLEVDWQGRRILMAPGYF